jgi:hypothetical protein
MPVPSSTVAEVFSGLDLAGRTILIGPTAFERLPFLAATLMRPLFADGGTVALRPFALRRWVTTVELLALRVRLRGNTTSIPGLKLRPLKRSVPPRETACGFAPQAFGGQHLTELMCGTGIRARPLAGAGASRPAALAATRDMSASAKIARRGDRQVVVTTTPSLACGVS